MNTRIINKNTVVSHDILIIAEKARVTPYELMSVTRNINTQYHSIQLLKRSGIEYRSINAPSTELKNIQRNILDNILKNEAILPYVYGLGKNKSIVDNAKKHSRNAYLLNIDIVNFFPSVHYSKIELIFKNLNFNSPQCKVLTRITTLNGSLPQGAPTSPALSSLALKNLDIRLKDLCGKNGLTYTRYFDDISISGTSRLKLVNDKILSIIISEGYKVHTSKEKFQFFTPEMTKIVTGIHIDTWGNLSVPNVKEIEEYLISIQINGIKSLLSDNPAKEKDVLRGKIAFISQVDEIKGIGLKTVFDRIVWE